jgi:predicted aspartyl protease
MPCTIAHWPAAALALVAFAMPAPVRAQAGHEHDPARYRAAAIDLPNDRASVPMEPLPGHRAAVRVMVNGAGPFLFAVETGASMVTITERAAREAHLVASQADSATTRHWPGGVAARRLVADSLRIGDAVFRGQPMVVGPELLAGVDGLLGLPLYSELLLTIDYPSKRLELARGSLPPLDGREVLPMLDLNRLTGIAISIGGKEVDGVIDTQGGTDIQVPPELGSTLPFVAPLAVVGQARIGVSEPVPVSAGRLAGDVTFGAFAITRPIVHVAVAPTEVSHPAILGTEVLRHFRVTLDQVNRRVRFEGPHTIAPAPSIRALGMSLAAAPDGSVSIAAVVPGGAAAAAGLQAGDAIIAIARRPAREFVASSLLATMAQAGEPIRFDLDRGGRQVSIEVTPAVRVE